MKDMKLILTFAGLALVGVTLLAILSADSTYAWTLDEINTLLGAAIPQDAIDVRFTGRQGVGGFLKLDFRAPPDSVNAFLQTICSGIIYEGYDPFSAIDISEPFTYAHPINIGEYPYYSYSPDTPATVWGNRCMNGGQLQIKVDTADSQLHAVYMEVIFSCELCQYIPISNVYPVEDFPLQVLGLLESNNTYLLSGREACIGIRQDSLTADQQSNELIGAEIQVSIDVRMIASAEVDNEGRLVNRRNAEHILVDITDSGNAAYYCFEPKTASGLHTMGIQVVPRSGRSHSFAWDIEVVEIK